MNLSTPSLASVDSDGSIPSGVYREFQFILSDDFTGTIGGASIDSAASGIRVVGPWVAGDKQKLAGISYTVETGSALIAAVS